MKKKFFAVLLAAVMALALLPTAALAENESGIQLGAGGIGTDDEVYFGTYGTTNVPWYVLNTTNTTVFLLSKYTIGTSIFRNNMDRGYYGQKYAGDANSGSVLKATMDGLYDGPGTTLFSGLEQGAIKETTLAGNSMVSGASDVTAHLFPLSNDEAEAIGWGNDRLKAPSITAPGGSAGHWWLRSSFSSSPLEAYSIDEDGRRWDSSHAGNYGVRPAFNLNLTSVLFISTISTALDGKASGAEGAGALNAKSSHSGATAWKLTLLDSTNHGTFDVSTTSVSTTTAGGNVSVSYSGATTGTKEYLSAMLLNSSNQVLYYGRMNQLTAGEASGAQTITIPALDAGGYTLKLFNEQYNDDKNTDYSSALKDVALTVAAPFIPVTDIAMTSAASVQANTDLTLAGTVTPTTATNKAIEWSLENAGGTGATVSSGGVFHATTAGTATVKAKVTNGASATTDYVKTFDVTVTAAPMPPQPPVDSDSDSDPTPTGPSITTEAQDAITAEGGKATFSVYASSVGSLHYQWQINRGKGWQDIPGATAASYITSKTALEHNGYQYRCIVGDYYGSVISAAVTLTVVKYAGMPQTGDSALPGLWMGILMLSGAGLAASVLLARKKRKA